MYVQVAGLDGRHGAAARIFCPAPPVRCACSSSLTCWPVSRTCRNEYFIRADIYTPPSIFTHGSLDLIRDRCAAFSNAPVGNQIADSVRTMISYPWRTGAYRSSSSAYCGGVIERFRVARHSFRWDCIRERSARPSGFSRRDTRRGPDLIHCRIRPYMNQGGAAGAPATGLCVGTPARHGRAAVAEAPQISRSHPSCYRCCAGPSSSLLIVQLVATASMAVLRAVARDRLRRPLTRRPVCVAYCPPRP